MNLFPGHIDTKLTYSENAFSRLSNTSTNMCGVCSPSEVYLQLLQEHGGLLPGSEVLRHGEVGGAGWRPVTVS